VDAKVDQLGRQQVIEPLVKREGVVCAALPRLAAAMANMHRCGEVILPHQLLVDPIGDIIGQHIPMRGRLHFLLIGKKGGPLTPRTPWCQTQKESQEHQE